MPRRAVVALAVAVMVAGACSAAAEPSAAPSVDTGWRFVSPAPSSSHAATNPGSAAPTGSASTAPAPSASARPAATATPKPSTAPATTGRITVKSQGFSVLLPKTWIAFDVDGQSNDAAVGSLLSKASGVKVTQQQAQQAIALMRAMMPGAVKFVAFKPSTFDLAKGFMATTVVARLPTGGATLNQLEAGMATSVGATNGALHLRHSQVKLANGRAVLVSYDLKMTVAGKESLIHYVTYLTTHDDSGYLTLLATIGAPGSQSTKELAAIAGSIKFLANANTNS